MYKVSFFVVSIRKGLKDNAHDNLPLPSVSLFKIVLLFAHFSEQITNMNKVTFKLIKNIALKIHSYFIHLYILFRNYIMDGQQNKKKDGNLYPHSGELF